MFLRLTLTYCTQGRSGTHFSFLEYRIVIERNREHSCLELKRSTKWKTFEHEQNAWGYWQPANAKPAIVWIGFQRKEISSRLLIPCRQVGIKLNNQILDQTHLEGKWLYCVDSVVVKRDLFQVLQPLEGLKIYDCFSQNNLDFGDFLISGLVASFPVLVLKCHPICLH